MKAVLSPLQVEFYGIDNVSVRSNESYEPEGDRVSEAKPTLEIHYTEASEEDSFFVVMQLAITEEEEAGVPEETIPYWIELEVVGQFSVSSVQDTEKLEWMQMFNAPAILYGFARAEVAHLTEKNTYGSYMLPTVDFISMANQYAVAEPTENGEE